MQGPGGRGSRLKFTLGGGGGGGEEEGRGNINEHTRLWCTHADIAVCG